MTRSSLGVEEKASHVEKASRIYAFIKPIRNVPRSFSFMVIFGGFNLHSKRQLRFIRLEICTNQLSFSASCQCVKLSARCEGTPEGEYKGATVEKGNEFKQT